MNFETLIEWMNTSIVHIGQTPLTLGGIGIAILIFLGSLIFSSVIQRVVFRKIVKTARLEEGVAFAIGRIVHYGIVILGVFLATQVIGLNLGSLAVLFGFLGVGIGLGLQNVTANFVAGLIILFERPISIGDFVDVDDRIGKVTSINMRTTYIQTLDRVTVIIPNSKFIDNHLTNWSIIDPKVRIHCPVGVAYGSDVPKVKELLLKVAGDHGEVLENPQPEVWFKGFGNSSLDFELLVWINNAAREEPVRSEINFAIDDAFRAADVVIPFPQRDLNLKMTPALESLKKNRLQG